MSFFRPLHIYDYVGTSCPNFITLKFGVWLRDPALVLHALAQLCMTPSGTDKGLRAFISPWAVARRAVLINDGINLGSVGTWRFPRYPSDNVLTSVERLITNLTQIIKVTVNLKLNLKVIYLSDLWLGGCGCQWAWSRALLMLISS